jgi:hypothetical protein
VSYVDLDTIHIPATGAVAPAAWGLQVRENQEFFIDPPAVSAFNSSGQSVPTGTLTVLNANSENFDTDGMHSTVSSTSRLTAQTAGRYLLVSAVSFDLSGTGIRRTQYQLNGTTAVEGTITTTNVGGGFSAGIVNVRMVILGVGDYVEVLAAHTHGSNLNVFLREFAATFITR